MARQQRRRLNGEVAAATTNDENIILTVPTATTTEDAVVITTSELWPEDMMRLRSNDLWMYHSIVNKNTGQTVCNFYRFQPHQDGDAAAGCGLGSTIGKQAHSLCLAASNSMRASHDVKRQSCFSTKECAVPDLLSVLGSLPHGAGEPVAVARAAKADDQLDQDEDSNYGLFEQYLSALSNLTSQAGEEEEEVDAVAANVSSE